MSKARKNSLTVSAGVALNRRGKAFISGNRIDLLEQIDQLGSISQAAKAVVRGRSGLQIANWSSRNSAATAATPRGDREAVLELMRRITSRPRRSLRQVKTLSRP